MQNCCSPRPASQFDLCLPRTPPTFTGSDPCPDRAAPWQITGRQQLCLRVSRPIPVKCVTGEMQTQTIVYRNCCHVEYIEQQVFKSVPTRWVIDLESFDPTKAITIRAANGVMFDCNPIAVNGGWQLQPFRQWHDRDMKHIVLSPYKSPYKEAIGVEWDGCNPRLPVAECDCAVLYQQVDVPVSLSLWLNGERQVFCAQSVSSDVISIGGNVAASPYYFGQRNIVGSDRALPTFAPGARVELQSGGYAQSFGIVEQVGGMLRLDKAIDVRGACNFTVVIEPPSLHLDLIDGCQELVWAVPGRSGCCAESFEGSYTFRADGWSETGCLSVKFTEFLQEVARC
jgi:hypothetical protein